MRESVKQLVQQSIETKQSILNNESVLDSIVEVANKISEAFTNNYKLMICGNGGSAADSQHMAAELTSILTADCIRPGLPAIALTTDTSFLTANANDFGFENIFARQVQALGNKGDILLGISTSGYSKNIIKAFEEAEGVTKVLLSGRDGGQLREFADYSIIVPSNSTQNIQECHIMIIHILCELIEWNMGYRD